MTPWNELSRKEQLAATHYDFYKDVYGIRPRWLDYNSITEHELELMIGDLGRASEEQDRIRAEQEAEAIKKFEQHVINTICMGARDRETALRWIMDASTAEGDWEYFCFLNGLPYGYFKEKH